MSSIALDQPNVVRGLQFIAGRVLPLVVWVTIFCGAFAFIEPSPYEFSFLLLLGIALLRGMAVPAVVLVPFALLVLFNLGGIISLAATEPEYDAQKFIAVSGYLSVTVIVIALVIAENPERMRVVKNAYIAAALVTAVAAIIGYFDIAGTGGVFTENSRARGMFKDPNVMAPFLILPAVLLLHDILRARFARTLFCAAILVPILIAILLAFSRGAWGHTFGSFCMFGWLLFVTSQTPRERIRIVFSALAAVVAAAVLVTAMLSVPRVGELFEVRAKLIQRYDGGEMGRFGKLRVAIPELVKRPNGFGPLQFRKFFKEEPHNVYVNAFASYGWIGGFAYAMFVAATNVAGLYAALSRTPFQHFAIAVFSTFSVLSLLGLVIDTDHWRHFYLLSGLAWGLFAASLKLRETIPINVTGK